MIYSKNIITLAVITVVALGILTSTQVNAISTQKNPAHYSSGGGKVIMWGLAKCVHNPKVGLICTGGMKNATGAGANNTK
ncbi:MAG TPA: hypothetical protein VEH06_06060 [Candidatus Bathyarchaeia archaeon]|nr:hypothetical protein [Candidatus Bathyarchaeia archaeon]